MLLYLFLLLQNDENCKKLNTNKITCSYFRDSSFCCGVMAEFDNVIDRLQGKFFIKHVIWLVSCVTKILLTGRAPSFDHILENILGYLDYACLKQAELVSPVWLEAVSERKCWKEIFLQNVGYFKC